jgi:hypothetical protein
MNIFINARLGDGCYFKYKTCKHWSISFSGVEKNWIEHKHVISKSNNKVYKRPQSLKAYGTKPIYFLHMTSCEVDCYAIMSIEEIINKMEIEDVIALYFDDGSWHKKKHFMHIYTNSFNKDENLFLIKKLKELLDINCKLRLDKKKTGKEYFYLALSVSDSNILKGIINDYIISYPNLSCFNYKIGLYE